MKDKVDFLPLGSVVIIRGGVKKFGGADNNADQIAEGTEPKDITWVVMNAGYSKADKENFKDSAASIGVNIVISDGTDDLIDYINN